MVCVWLGRRRYWLPSTTTATHNSSLRLFFLFFFFVFPYHFGERDSSQEGGQHAQNTTTTWANRMEMSSADHQRKEKEVGVTKSQFPFF
jgi:hypothetical protein